MFFWNSLAFSRIQQILAIWSLAPLPFLNPAWTSGGSYTVHILWSSHTVESPSLEKLEHYFISVWDECSCVVVWTFFGIAFLWDGIKTDLFQSCVHCWIFQICWHTDCITLTASSFRMLNAASEIQISEIQISEIQIALDQSMNWKW